MFIEQLDDVPPQAPVPVHAKRNKTPKHKVNYSSTGLEAGGCLIFLLLTNESIIEKEGRRILKRW
jgi:hypothetical protein